MICMICSISLTLRRYISIYTHDSLQLKISYLGLFVQHDMADEVLPIIRYLKGVTFLLNLFDLHNFYEAYGRVFFRVRLVDQRLCGLQAGLGILLRYAIW
jgi:hypothetical protein